MSESEKKLEQMLKDFEKANPDAGKVLRQLVDETPALKGNLLTSIEKGNLERIEPTPASMPSSIPGFYVPKTEKLPTGEELKANSIHISTAELIDAGKDPKIANTMRLIMTHESEHALNKQSILKADKDFVDKLEGIAKGPSPHDYTSVLADKGKSDRLREATDQIGGFNAVAAHVFKQNPGATEAQLNKKLYDSSPEMAPYFDVKGTAPKETYELKAGLTLGKDGQLARTPENIEAMAKHFYDARPYQQNYGTRDLARALQTEFATQAAEAAKDPAYKAPEVKVNLKELGLQHLSPHLPIGVTDTSPSPYIRGVTPEPAPAPREGHAHPHGSEGHQQNFQEMLKQLNITPQDREQFRNEGREQFQQLQMQKAQEAKPAQPTQDAPVQEAAPRKVGAI
jgi:hypothetical protein